MVRLPPVNLLSQRAEKSVCRRHGDIDDHSAIERIEALYRVLDLLLKRVNSVGRVLVRLRELPVLAPMGGAVASSAVCVGWADSRLVGEEGLAWTCLCSWACSSSSPA